MSESKNIFYTVFGGTVVANLNLKRGLAAREYGWFHSKGGAGK